MKNKKWTNDELNYDRSDVRQKCECGHSLYIPAYLDSIICSYCHKRVKNNTKARFRKMMITLLNEK